MATIIRFETTADYNGIANLNYSAFSDANPHYFKSEPLIAAVLRHNQYFDPELSLVAEADGKVIGHALFSPFEFIVLGERRKGVLLAPLAVDTAFHHQGIGSRLLAEGHRVAAAKGYSFSLLCGIPDYYPRFGYQQRAFALAGATVRIGAALPTDVADVVERPVTEADLPWIVERWLQVHGNDRLAWFPGDRISQWFNHSLAYRSSVIWHGDRRVGYVKGRKDNPGRINELLTERGAAEVVLAYLLRGQAAEESGEFVFSMTEDAIRAQLAGCGQVETGSRLRVSDAFMLKVLDTEDELLRRYCLEAKLTERNLGVLAFPTLLDIDN